MNQPNTIHTAYNHSLMNFKMHCFISILFIKQTFACQSNGIVNMIMETDIVKKYQLHLNRF